MREWTKQAGLHSHKDIYYNEARMQLKKGKHVCNYTSNQSTTKELQSSTYYVQSLALNSSSYLLDGPTDTRTHTHTQEMVAEAFTTELQLEGQVS